VGSLSTSISIYLLPSLSLSHFSLTLSSTLSLYRFIHLSPSLSLCHDLSHSPSLCLTLSHSVTISLTLSRSLSLSLSLSIYLSVCLWSPLGLGFGWGMGYIWNLHIPDLESAHSKMIVGFKNIFSHLLDVILSRF
jgi:hypothetical protein